MEVKKHILRFNKKNYQTFDQIRKGSKKVETRAASPKYQSVKKGDILVLTCAGEKLEKIVKKTLHIKSIPTLYKRYKITAINPHITSTKEAYEIFYKYPGYREKIKEFGLMAFEI